MNIIDFNDIYSKFLKIQPGLKISYLTSDELDKVTNFPIKEPISLEISFEQLQQIKKNNGICLIFLSSEIQKPKTNKHIKDTINDILNSVPNLQYAHLYYLNRKFAAVTAGLGQYGKNQLVYNQDFGFHHTIWTFAVFNPVINLPIRKTVNYAYMDLCTNCNECIKNCPAHAIHADDYPGWLNRDACQDFFRFGDHEKITSIKYGTNVFLGKPLSDEQLKTIKNNDDFEKLFGFPNTEHIIHKDGKTYRVDFSFCSECKNQLPCRKVEQKYNKDYYRVVHEQPYSADVYI